MTYGAIHWKVPNRLACFFFCFFYCPDKPKSHTFTFQFSPNSTFELFKSLWRIFFMLCRYTMPFTISKAMSSCSSGANFFFFLCNWSKRLPFSRYSVMRVYLLAVMHMPMYRTIFGCFKSLIISSSFMKSYLWWCLPVFR